MEKMYHPNITQKTTGIVTLNSDKETRIRKVIRYKGGITK
jgi:hypothetical protein